MSPLPVNDKYNDLVAARGALISTIADIAEGVALAPGLHAAQGQRMVNAVRPFLVAFEASLKAAHTSSTSLWAERDLPSDQISALVRTRHAISLLDRLYADGDMKW